MPRTISQVEIGNIRLNCGEYPEAESLRKRLVSEPDDRLLDATDSSLIDFVPDIRMPNGPCWSMKVLCRTAVPFTGAAVMCLRLPPIPSCRTS